MLDLYILPAKKLSTNLPKSSEKRGPEEAKPIIIQSKDYSQKVFEDARNALLEKGLVPPENPFE